MSKFKLLVEIVSSGMFLLALPFMLPDWKPIGVTLSATSRGLVGAVPVFFVVAIAGAALASLAIWARNTFVRNAE